MTTGPARPRSPLPSTFALAVAAATAACGPSEPDGAPASEPSAAPEPAPAAAGPPWRVRALADAPPRFRPGGWTGPDALWGILSGSPARLDPDRGTVETRSETAWSVAAGPGVVSWRNGEGLWVLRGGGTLSRVAGTTDPGTGFDGPPDVLWSPDGGRAVLTWQGELDVRHTLLVSDGSTRPLDARLEGYLTGPARLWLDAARVLVEVVATGPRGGPPAYRESGWRGDLAVLDLPAGGLRRVTDVDDGVFLAVAGRHGDGVLVTERTGGSPRRHWRYEAGGWTRAPVALPPGRAFGSGGAAAVVLGAEGADSVSAVLVAGGDTVALGFAPTGEGPAFTPDGRRGALRLTTGVVLFEEGPPSGGGG